MLFTEELKRQIFAPAAKRAPVAKAIIVEQATKKTSPVVSKPVISSGLQDQRPKSK